MFQHDSVGPVGKALRTAKKGRVTANSHEACMRVDESWHARVLTSCVAVTK